MALLETNTKYQQCECQNFMCDIISLKIHLLVVFFNQRTTRTTLAQL